MEKGATVGGWLNAKLLSVFRRHVGTEAGLASKWVKTAIVEKLQREGAFDAKQETQLAAAMRDIGPEATPLIVTLAELLKARGPDVVRAKLDELSVETANAEKAVA